MAIVMEFRNQDGVLIQIDDSCIGTKEEQARHIERLGEILYAERLKKERLRLAKEAADRAHGH